MKIYCLIRNVGFLFVIFLYPVTCSSSFPQFFPNKHRCGGMVFQHGGGAKRSSPPKSCLKVGLRHPSSILSRFTTPSIQMLLQLSWKSLVRPAPWLDCGNKTSAGLQGTSKWRREPTDHMAEPEKARMHLHVSSLACPSRLVCSQSGWSVGQKEGGKEKERM